jgi:hypothetical protein
MRKMGLCFLASLLLCDKKINAEGAEEQRSVGMPDSMDDETLLLCISATLR